MEEIDRPSASFLTPTRDRTNVSHYVDEADIPSILMPNNPLTFNTKKEKLNLIRDLSRAKIPTHSEISKEFPEFSKSKNFLLGMKSPKTRVEELHKEKEEINKLKDLRQKLRF